jgi:Putative addiction module component
MDTVLPLDRMSTAEKLRAMEEIWADLSRHEAQLESPAWHQQVLQEREARVESGRESYVDWEAAKAALRQRQA